MLHGGAVVRRMSGADFFELCRLNPDLRIERSAEGDLYIMPPTGGETGRINARMTRLLDTWAEGDGTGIAFDSSTGFALPNGAHRSPDAAWVARSRWDALTAEERERFPPLCPDFVVEIRSPSDDVDILEAKLREYIDNGARLGWLIEPQTRRVSIYRPVVEVEQLDAPVRIAADPVLPGFVLDLRRLWG